MVKIAVASGKGGTGKTLIATNLARAIKNNVSLLDCDVEEPNCHIFLQPEQISEKEITVPFPIIDQEKCSLCGKCKDICQFNAIAVLPKDVLIFYELCHSCGGCVRFCPENAISEVNREVGVVLEGNINGITCIYGKMNIGEARPSPIIRAVKDYIVENKISIIDVPPGTSCPVVESIIGIDYCILVTEPTPFGMSDLNLAVELVKKLNIPTGVVINRADIGNEEVRKFCIERDLEILMEIPYHKEIAENYSKGFLIVDMYPHWKNLFLELFEKIKARTNDST